MSEDDTVTLREYAEFLLKAHEKQQDEQIHRIEGNLCALQKSTAARFDWLDKTTADLAVGMEKRLDGMNEFRDTIKDLKGEFPTRNEVHAITRSLEVDVRSLQKYQSEVEGSRQQIAGKASNLQVTVAILLGAIGAITGIVSAALQMFGKIKP